ncbi:uncharacterized protein LOC144620581 [Crassostrea virginica]
MGKRKLRWLSHFQYKKGNKLHNKDCKGHDSDVQANKRPPVERLTCDTFQEMTAELWSTAFKDHLDKIPTCTGSLDWDYSREQKRGLAWITSLRCCTCGYKSPPHKLYQEISSPGPGRKAARINVALYNNSMFSAVGKNPFQAGTQVTYTLCENVTKKKRVISVFCGNKLCKVGELMRSRGESVTCPGHDNCTANIPADENIGNEKRWAGQCLDEIQQDSSPLILSQLTTDGDSTATLGASTQQGQNIENLKDLHHFFESQRKQTCKAPFSDKMFPGGTKTARESVKKRFAQDLKIRCRTEYENAYQHFGGDIPKLIRAMSYSGLTPVIVFTI